MFPAIVRLSILFTAITFGPVLAESPDLTLPKAPTIPGPTKPGAPTRVAKKLPPRAVWSDVRAIAPASPPNDIRTVMFSPDGRTIASSSGTVIEIWNVANGSLVKELAGHEHIVNSLAFSPDGKTLASASFDRTVRFWDVAAGKERHRGVGHTEGIAFLAFAPDGLSVATGAYDNTVRIWDSGTGKQKHSLEGSSSMILGLAFSHDSQTLASCGGEPTIRLWNLQNGKLQATLEGSTANVRSVAFTKDGKQLLSSCCDGSLRLWDVTTKKQDLTWAGHRDDVFVIAKTIESGTVLSGSHDGTIAQWNVTNGKRLKEWTAHAGGVICFHLSPDEKTLVSGGYDKAIRLWDVSTGRERLRFGSHQHAHQSSANAVAISSDGGLLASADSHGEIIVRDARTGILIRRIMDPLSNFPAPERSGVSDLAFSPGSRELIAVGLDGVARRWDPVAGKLLRVSQSGSTPLYALAIAPDGKSIAVAGKDGRIVVYDPTLTKGELLTGHKEAVVSLSFGSTGEFLVSASHDQTARLWDMKTRKESMQFVGHERALTSAVLAPDGKTLWTSSFDKTVRNWNVATGREIIGDQWKLPRPGALAISSDGKRLASAADDEIRVREIGTAKDELVLDPQGDRITSLAFAVDGKFLASATVDGSVTMWDTSDSKNPDTSRLPTDRLLNVWWDDLIADDLTVVHRSIWGLIDNPAGAVPFIRERTQPAKGPGRERIRRWLTELDNDRFPIREAATKGLLTLGPSVLPVLKEHLLTKLSPEARERIEKLVEKLLVQPFPPEELRAARVVEILERIGTVEARAVLERLRSGDPDAILTTLASGALNRMTTKR